MPRRAVTDPVSIDSDVVDSFTWWSEVKRDAVLRCLLDHAALQSDSLYGRHTRRMSINTLLFLQREVGDF